jgi:hypothetical protein
VVAAAAAAVVGVVVGRVRDDDSADSADRGRSPYYINRALDALVDALAEQLADGVGSRSNSRVERLSTANPFFFPLLSAHASCAAPRSTILTYI